MISEKENVMTLPDEPEIQAHEYCSIDCPCGHWSEYRRRATSRGDGRRGKPNLDIIDSDHEADRLIDGTR